MIPVIAQRGTSFAGAFAYYFHDKKAWSIERIAWSETINLLTDCVEKGWKWMAYTAKHQDRLKEFSGQRMTGAKLSKPVFCYSLSWHPEQRPSKEAMLKAAHETLETLGLEEHQAMIVAHKDEPHPHLHVMACVVHPLTGLVAKLKNTKRKLSEFALNYERKEGKMYCPKREENHAMREKGQKTKYCNPIIGEAWERSVDGETFQAALQVHGYELALGRKRVVVVDKYGKTANPLRELDGVRSSEFKKLVNDLDLDCLPTVEEVIQRRKRADPVSEKPERIIGAQKHSLEETFADALLPHYQQSLRSNLKKLFGDAAINKKQCRILKLERKQQLSGIFQKITGLYCYRKRKLDKLQREFDQASRPYVERDLAIEFAQAKAVSNLSFPSIHIDKHPSGYSFVNYVHN